MTADDIPNLIVMLSAQGTLVLGIYCVFRCELARHDAKRDREAAARYKAACEEYKASGTRLFEQARQYVIDEAKRRGEHVPSFVDDDAPKPPAH